MSPEVIAFQTERGISLYLLVVLNSSGHLRTLFLANRNDVSSLIGMVAARMIETTKTVEFLASSANLGSHIELSSYGVSLLTFRTHRICSRFLGRCRPTGKWACVEFAVLTKLGNCNCSGRLMPVYLGKHERQSTPYRHKSDSNDWKRVSDGINIRIGGFAARINLSRYQTGAVGKLGYFEYGKQNASHLRQNEADKRPKLT